MGVWEYGGFVTPTHPYTHTPILVGESMGAKEILESGAAELGVKLDENQLDAFDRYTALLLEWNRKFNLTRITEPDEIAVKHYVDSLAALKFVRIPPGSKLIDVGTGAGFPGIPLKIAVPGLKLTLLDSVKKRLTFLEAVVQEIALPDVCIVHGRAEDAAQDRAHRATYDFSVSRAVARLNVLCELCMPFCRTGGKFIAYKGSDVDEEVEEARKAISILGGKLDAVHKFTLPESDLQRSLVIVGKTEQTPRAYPRKAGTPERQPL